VAWEAWVSRAPPAGGRHAAGTGEREEAPWEMPRRAGFCNTEQSSGSWVLEAEARISYRNC
jgi:hypothetical protein